MTWFKQLSFYRLAGAVDHAALAAALERRPFTPCGGLDWFSDGWVPPAPHLDKPMHTGRSSHLVALRREDKVLPVSVIRNFVEVKVREIEDKELRRPGRKERAAIKEQVTDDLLPRAFVRPSHTIAYIDNMRGWLMVDSASAGKAESVVSRLREALPPFPAALPRTKLAPHSAMTDWLAAGNAPGAFELDSDAVLRDGGENGAQVKVSRFDLTAEEIRQHIATGKQVTQLGLIWNEKIRFQLTDDLRLKRIQFLDVLQDEASQAGDDRESLFAATFLLMSEELGELVESLIDTLGGLEESQARHEGTTQIQAPALPIA
ncbi:recombination-associated protein RdgC [Chromobacterium phragmitis]|uniref:recombination-associated protein RdgC n=1 Tax=Chromobacterium amazonense TaxID=1382803 RepID=UPI0021B800B8|nr:recombination-associated protein RdgC [Chromobacterium amazonense]MBM2884056.1 recombination-associated protein RdgC [Chromobacterium amazonense]